MAMAGYDFNNLTPFEKLTEAKSYGIKETQRKIQEQGEDVNVSRPELGCSSLKPISISAHQKEDQSSSQYITMIEEEDGEGEDPPSRRKVSVIDGLQSSSAKRCSFFERL